MSNNGGERTFRAKEHSPRSLFLSKNEKTKTNLVIIYYHFLQYTDAEEVVLWMNTVGPYANPEETYSYFSLPFCAGTKTRISHYHETLGENLLGVELQFLGVDIKFKSESYRHR